jgi:hypothetical protein
MIVQTRQMWKLWVAAALLLVALALQAASMFYGEELLLPRVGRIWVGPLGFAFGIATLSWTIVSIRCPRCRRSLAYWAISRNAWNRWLPTLLGLKACPICGSNPGEKLLRSPTDDDTPTLG